MKILKFILWPILLLCISWMGAIFFGPSLISTAASYFSEGKISLTRVTVSPKLKISAAVVDFSIPLDDKNTNLHGEARALLVGWKIENGFALIGNIGPSNLIQIGSFESASFKLEPNSLFDWSEVDVQFEFEQVVGTSFDVSNGYLNGNLINYFNSLEDFEVVFLDLHGNVENAVFGAERSVLTLDRFDLGQPLVEQTSDITFGLQKVLFPESSFESSLVQGEIELLNGEANFKVEVSDAKLSKQKIKVKSLNASVRRFLSADTIDRDWIFSVSEIEVDSPRISIKEYSGNITTSPLQIVHTGRAIISELELKNDQYFFGKIESGIVDIDLVSRILPSKLEVDGRGSLTLKKVDDFSAKVSVEAALTDKGFLRCFDQKCDLGTLGISYDITTSGFSLSGDLKCEMANCFNRPKHHTVKTDNTNEFFQSIAKTGILSPLALPVAFMAISSGEIVGDGHVLKF